jgi:hypothetical protein
MIFQELVRRVDRTDFFVGGRFVYFNALTTFDGAVFPPNVVLPSFRTREGGLGVTAEFDTRDNSFTPSRGVLARAVATFMGPYMGGDTVYQKYSFAGAFYANPCPRLVLGLDPRARTARGDVPFCELPFILLRGVAAMRYQGESALYVVFGSSW